MNKIKDKLFNFKFLIKTGITFMIIALISPFVLAPLIYKVAERFGGIENLGPTGDLLGGSTVPFFNIASILLILATIAIQREELTLTRDELKLTRAEFKEQNTTLSIQRFENTFFQMVNLHNNLTSKLRKNVSKSGGYLKPIIEIELQGKAVITEALSELKSIYKQKSWVGEKSIEETLKIIRISYASLYKAYDNELGNYFRNLYHIIKFIDESDINEKQTYIRIIRAQLSTDELILLLYNGLSEYGSTEVLQLLNKYNFLHNIENRKELMLSENDYEIYLNYETYFTEH
ncbi:putative phage abortive infection protein [Bacillus cereus]|uniref:putative phage abortive infection protein n=1 Tax=Bacillus cereus TaxID=1396 RepID=UPI001E45A8BD|nr:putative phage abortive infection protein [Bacillus cereus]